jgi:hypothetical protein
MLEVYFWLGTFGSLLTIMALSRNNWTKAVHSITEGVKAQVMVSFKHLKKLLNLEIAALNGPSPRFEAAMGTSNRPVGSKCVLASFGPQKRGCDFKVVCVLNSLQRQNELSTDYFVIEQEGIAPYVQKEINKFPFFVSSYDQQRIQKLHFMWGNVSRLDFAKNDASAGAAPRSNWFDDEGVFMNRVDMLEDYGPSYMHLFMKLCRGMGSWGKKVRNIKTAAGVDNMLAKTMTM